MLQSKIDWGKIRTEWHKQIFWHSFILKLWGCYTNWISFWGIIRKHVFLTHVAELESAIFRRKAEWNVCVCLARQLLPPVQSISAASVQQRQPTPLTAPCSKWMEDKSLPLLSLSLLRVLLTRCALRVLQCWWRRRTRGCLCPLSHYFTFLAPPDHARTPF